MEQMFFGFSKLIPKTIFASYLNHLASDQNVLSGSKLDLNSNKTVGIFFLMIFILYQIYWEMTVNRFSWLKCEKYLLSHLKKIINVWYPDMFSDNEMLYPLGISTNISARKQYDREKNKYSLSLDLDRILDSMLINMRCYN